MITQNGKPFPLNISKNKWFQVCIPLLTHNIPQPKTNESLSNIRLAVVLLPAQLGRSHSDWRIHSVSENDPWCLPSGYDCYIDMVFRNGPNRNRWFTGFTVRYKMGGCSMFQTVNVTVNVITRWWIHWSSIKNIPIYPLVNCHITIERSTIF